VLFLQVDHSFSSLLIFSDQKVFQGLENLLEVTHQDKQERLSLVLIYSNSFVDPGNPYKASDWIAFTRKIMRPIKNNLTTSKSNITVSLYGFV